MITMFACGLTAGRFTSFSLKPVSRLVRLNLSAERDGCVLLSWAGTPSSSRRAPHASRQLAALHSLRTAASSDTNPQQSHWDITPCSQPTRQDRSTIPPNTRGHKATFQGKATNELSICPGGNGCTHHARVPRTSLTGVGALSHACTVPSILPPL